MDNEKSKLGLLWETKNKNDEWWSSFVTAPLAIVVNLIVVDFRWLTPNRITLLSFIVAIVSTVFIIQGGWENFIIAAVLIHASHILDCMDGQMARYRGIASPSGSYFDKLTDQIQVVLWFGSVGYASYAQSQSVLPVFLAFTGVAFYSLRGYTKYVTIYTEMVRDNEYLEKKLKETLGVDKEDTAGLGHGVLANLKWFVREQRKIFSFDEGVFIFMLSLALVLDILTPMLWFFAISQLFLGLFRGCQRGWQIHHNKYSEIEK
jgi:phosphatidylglycerophosphate synthase